MNIFLIPITRFIRNPYQARETEDPEHIRKLAESIQTEGLQQIPSGRIVGPQGPINPGAWPNVAKDGEYNVQLAFGHSRLAAFVLLASFGMSDYMEMPVNLQELQDEEMFRLGISENLARKDLTPIEEARAMLVYREKFGKTSAEIGKLFGIGESAVRNKLRLLDLPEAARQKLDQGEISEGTARQLLTLQVVANPEKVDQMAEKLANGGYESPEQIKQEITQSMQANSKEMWGGWYTKEGEPRGGVALWPLNWIPEEPMCINTDALKRVLQKDWPDLVKDRKKLEIYYQQIWDELGVAETAKKYEVPVGFLELVNVLIHKTPCTVCPFYARLDGKHFCGQEACWKAKREVWFYHDLREVSEKLGIPIYDPEKDGKEIITPRSGSWEDHVDRNFTEWVKKKNPGLRLKAHYEEYSENSHTKSKTVELVMTGEAAEKKKRETKERKEKEEQKSSSQHQDWELIRKRQETSRTFILTIALPIFVTLLAPLENLAFLEWACNGKAEGENRKEKLADCHRALMRTWLDNRIEYQILQGGPVEVAKHLQGVATTIGLALPVLWMELAEQYAAGAGVSVETEEAGA